MTKVHKHKWTAVVYRPDGNYKLCKVCGETGEKVLSIKRRNKLDAGLKKVMEDYSPALQKLANT